jgi:membrane protease YdiL (CAAX protease family)
VAGSKQCRYRNSTLTDSSAETAVASACELCPRCAPRSAKMPRHAATGETNSWVLTSGICVFQPALLPHDPHRAHWRGKWDGGFFGDVVSRIRCARYLRAVPDRPGNTRLELAAGSLCGMGLCDSDSLLLPVYVAAWTAIPGSFAFWVFAAPLAKAFGFPGWPRATALPLAIPCYATLGVISSTAHALGEEIEWRGFLLPRLVAQTGFPWGCLLSGCIWAVWH